MRKDLKIALAELQLIPGNNKNARLLKLFKQSEPPTLDDNAKDGDIWIDTDDGVEYKAVIDNEGNLAWIEK